MEEIKLFAKIHSNKDLGNNNIIIDIEIVSLNDTGFAPNIDFIIKIGKIEKIRITNNKGFYRNDEFFENIKNLKNIELLNNKKELISNYYFKQKSNNYEVKDLIVEYDDMDVIDYITWSLDENEDFIKGQIIATVIGRDMEVTDYSKDDEVSIKQIKAKENGVLLTKYIGVIEEFMHKENGKKFIKNRKIPKGKKTSVEIEIDDKFVIGQYATYK